MSTAYVGEASLEFTKVSPEMGGGWLLSIAERPQSTECCIRLSSAELQQLIDWMQGYAVEFQEEDGEVGEEADACHDDGNDGGLDVTESEDEEDCEAQQ